MGAAAAAIVPAVISLVGGIYSAHQANKARQQEGDIMKQQLGLQKETQPWAKQFLGQSGQALGPALSYYTGMLANPREATAPEQNRVSSLYAGSAASAMQNGPRGAYGPAAAEGIRNQHRSALEGIIQQGRPMAANALSGLGSNLAGLGFQGYGLGAGILGNVFNQGLQARNQQFQQGSAVGSGLFNAYNSYLLSQSMRQPGDSGNSPSPTISPNPTPPPGYQPSSPNSGFSGLYGTYGPQ